MRWVAETACLCSPGYLVRPYNPPPASLACPLGYPRWQTRQAHTSSLLFSSGLIAALWTGSFTQLDPFVFANKLDYVDDLDANSGFTNTVTADLTTDIHCISIPRRSIGYNANFEHFRRSPVGIFCRLLSRTFELRLDCCAHGVQIISRGYSGDQKYKNKESFFILLCMTASDPLPSLGFEESRRSTFELSCSRGHLE